MFHLPSYFQPKKGIFKNHRRYKIFIYSIVSYEITVFIILKIQSGICGFLLLTTFMFTYYDEPLSFTTSNFYKKKNLPIKARKRHYKTAMKPVILYGTESSCLPSLEGLPKIERSSERSTDLSEHLRIQVEVESRNL